MLMRHSISKLMYLASIFLIAGLFSCEGPAGADGTDGIDGVDGVDGQDGNANVTIVTLEYADITWTADTYLGRTANVFDMTEPAVTQDIIDHGTVLGFCFLSARFWALPFTWHSDGGTLVQHVLHSYALNTISLYAYTTSGVMDPNGITQYRFLIITDNTVNKSVASGQRILDKMEKAGVDVTDYYSVMDYFGLNY